MAPDVSPVAMERPAPATKPGAAPAEKSAARDPGTVRLLSLDAFRGFTMFWIVGGSGLVLGLQSLSANPVTNFIVHQLEHTPWRGLRFYDCIWPSFMLMVGVSVPFSVAKRSLTETQGQIMMHTPL